MMKQLLKNKKGIAFIITLGFTALIVASGLELNKDVRTAVLSSVETRDYVTLSQMASSGIHTAMAMLVNDKTKDERESKFVDSLQEDWANPDMVTEALAALAFEQGSVDVVIMDEMGKIQVNALVDFPMGKELNGAQRELWDRLLRPVVSQDEESDINETADIINAVKDWLDYGDDDAITGLNGAESDYYQTLDPPYACRNGPFTHLGELFLVKGFTPELLQDLGTAAFAEMSELYADSFGGMDFENAEDMLGEQREDGNDLSSYMTVFGMSEAKKEYEGKKFTFEGKININTADLAVITAMLPEGDEYLAADITEYRGDGADSEEESESLPDLSSPTWYKNAPGCSDVKIDSKLITTTSDFFRIESSAQLNDKTMMVTAVVHREKAKKTNKWKCKVLSWQTN